MPASRVKGPRRPGPGRRLTECARRSPCAVCAVPVVPVDTGRGAAPDGVGQVYAVPAATTLASGAEPKTHNDAPTRLETDRASCPAGTRASAYRDMVRATLPGVR